VNPADAAVSVAAEDGAADATAIAIEMQTVREAPAQPRNSRTAGAAMLHAATLQAPTQTVRPPQSSTKAPRLAKALPAPMEAAAGAVGAAAVAGAEETGRQAML
jgi:hypothetical protein